jgi:hypothetical protein
MKRDTTFRLLYFSAFEKPKSAKSAKVNRHLADGGGSLDGPAVDGPSTGSACKEAVSLIARLTLRYESCQSEAHVFGYGTVKFRAYHRTVIRVQPYTVCQYMLK